MKKAFEARKKRRFALAGAARLKLIKKGAAAHYAPSIR
jgi:hypothetical protein